MSKVERMTEPSCVAITIPYTKNIVNFVCTVVSPINALPWTPLWDCMRLMVVSMSFNSLAELSLVDAFVLFRRQDE